MAKRNPTALQQTKMMGLEDGELSYGQLDRQAF